MYHYCPNNDHYQCFISNFDKGFYYAHSVEELVVWTVEATVGAGTSF